MSHEIPSLTKNGERPMFLNRTVVVIPALNEEESISATIRQWQHWSVAQVRVVDNGSRDQTAEWARIAGAEVLLEPTCGYGAAAWRGVMELPDDIEWVLFSSGDGSDRLEPGEADAFQRAVMAGADLILGERLSLADSRRHLKAVQILGNQLCCGLIHLGWGRRFRDLASLRLIRRSALAALNLKDRGFGWNIEMQVRAVEQGLRVAEIPVSYHPRVAGSPKISGTWRGTVRAGWGMLYVLGQLWCEKRKGVSAPHEPVAEAHR